MNKIKTSRMNGFTLVELLVVIGILAILTAVVLVAINPGRQLGQSRDTARRAGANAILAAITALNADPDASSSLPSGVLPCDNGAGGTQFSEIWADATADILLNQVDYSVLAPTYIAAIPEDPQDATPLGDTGYTICVDSSGIRYTVCPAVAEIATVADMCVTR